MDREADVIRSEMNHTRAQLDQKITRLESRAKQMTPRAYARRHMPDYVAERLIGTALTIIGATMAWKALRRNRTGRRDQLRAVLNARRGW
jgi:hypothetical protein